MGDRAGTLRGVPLDRLEMRRSYHWQRIAKTKSPNTREGSRQAIRAIDAEIERRGRERQEPKP